MITFSTWDFQRNSRPLSAFEVVRDPEIMGKSPRRGYMLCSMAVLRHKRSSYRTSCGKERGCEDWSTKRQRLAWRRAEVLRLSSPTALLARCQWLLLTKLAVYPVESLADFRLRNVRASKVYPKIISPAKSAAKRGANSSPRPRQSDPQTA